MALLQRIQARQGALRALATPRLVFPAARHLHGSVPTAEEKKESAPAANAADANSKITMKFADYRELKQRIKMRSRLAGIPIGMLSMFGASFTSALMYPNMFDPPDPANPTLILGMDPILASVLASLVSGAVGYSVGSSLQRALWGVFNRDMDRQIKLRDADFLKRIAKHRVEEYQKQDDDYYGEKVLTVGDYRRWLKAQRKKRMPPDDTKLDWSKKPVGF